MTNCGRERVSLLYKSSPITRLPILHSSFTPTADAVTEHRVTQPPH